VPCAAHTIQLCVKNILLLTVFKTVIADMAAFLPAFERNKDLRLSLQAAFSKSIRRTSLLPQNFLLLADQRICHVPNV
jgi:hypothetical protein